MRSKKRYAALLLTAALGMSMSACGAAEEENAGANPEPGTVQTDEATEQNGAQRTAQMYPVRRRQAGAVS